MITLAGRKIYHIAESEFRKELAEFLKHRVDVDIVVSHDAPKYFSDKDR